MTFQPNEIHIVVAIDFGTSRSGYGFARTGGGREINVCYEWPHQPFPYVKAPTTLLYSPQNELAAWGWTARHEVANIRKKGQGKGWSLVREFKLHLHNQNGAGNQFGPEYVAPGGKRFRVIDLITDCLTELKKFALEELAIGKGGATEERNILWCLSVPAIWNERDKEWMRRAAERAGLIGPGEAEANRLCLVLEPEAAALYCQLKDQQISSQLQPGSTFMVVDAGGGTIDLTVHKVLSDGALEEVVAGDGSCDGSTSIDREFLTWLKQQLGEEVIKNLHDEQPYHWVKFLDDWERVKCNYNPTNRHWDEEYVDFSSPLENVLKSKHPAVYQRLYQAQGGHLEAIHLDRATLSQIFSPVLDRVTATVHRLFQRLDRTSDPACDYLFVVGGFATCPALRDRFEQAFARRVKRIVFPPEPGKAVLWGAVRYGLDQSLIRRRRARYTYGCRFLAPFQAGVDPESKRIERKDLPGYRCLDRFNVFVKAGDAIDIHQQVIREFHPSAKDQTRAVISLHRTLKREVRYTDEEGVERIGELSIKLPNTGMGVNRRVRIGMYFGRTQIAVEVKDLSSSEVSTVTLSFNGQDSPIS